MKRTQLVTNLEKVSPALSSNDILPVLTHFWFTGDQVVASNGNVTIAAPCKTDFDACIPGTPLLNVMKAANAKDVEFEIGKDTVKIRAEKSRMRIDFVTMDASSFAEQCKIPKPPKTVLPCKPAEFLNAIKTCLQSVSTDTSIPDQLGVTLLPGDDYVATFATNGQTMTRGIVGFKGEFPVKKRAILSPLFCKQLLELADPKKPIRLEIDAQGAVFDDGAGTILYGLLIDSDRPLPYRNVFKQHYDEQRDGALVPIASKLLPIVERACVIAGGDMVAVHTRITVRDGIAKFRTESRLGIVADEMRLVDGHPDTTIDVDPRLIRAACTEFEKMLITDRCFVMANKTAFHLIAGKEG